MARFKYTAIHATGAGPSFTNLDGATMDYLSTGIGFARFSASGATAGTSRGVKVRTLNAGTPVDAISAVADGTMTFAKGHIVTSGTTQMQAATCTTLAGTGAVSGFTTAAFSSTVKFGSGTAVTGTYLGLMPTSNLSAAAGYGFGDSGGNRGAISMDGSFTYFFGTNALSNAMTLTSGGVLTVAAGLTVSAGTTAVQALTATGLAVNSADATQGNVSSSGTSQTPFAANRTEAVAAIMGHVRILRNSVVKSFIGLDASDHFAIINAAGNAAIFSLDNAGAGTFAAGISCTTGTFSGTGTTASAANAFIDGATGLLSRSTSSRRYKERIATIGVAESRRVVSRLRPVTYQSKAAVDDRRRRFLGLIAEEVAAVDPKLVHHVNGRPDGVMYDRLVVPMLKVMQEQERRIARLERRIAA